MLDLTKKQQRILELAKQGGTDKDLLLLEEIFALREEVEGKIQEMNKSHEEMVGIFEAKGGKDMKLMMDMMATMKMIAEKEIPAPVINIPETKIEVKAPIVNVSAPNVKVDLPLPAVIPAPIVNIKSDSVAMPHPGIEELRELIEDVKKELQDKIDEKARPVIFGPGKTRIVLNDLSSQLNGSTKKFFLGTHYGIISVQSSSMPFGAWREGTDYTESGQSIQFTDAVDAALYLQAGQSLIVKVLK